MSSAAASSSSDIPVTRSASPLHVVHCFDTIVEQLNGAKHAKPVNHTWNGDKFPLFVTWKKRHGSVGEWKLRGCIGTFSAKELSAGLREYAVIAAFHDSRFTPIDASELAQLKCDISLLTRFEPCPLGSILDWTIGVHGIQIDFTDPLTHRSYNATFLPEVAKEQGWSREETIEELVHKSGYRGHLTAAIKARIQLTRYQSEKASLRYDEYVALREKLVTSREIPIANGKLVASREIPIANGYHPATTKSTPAPKHKLKAERDNHTAASRTFDDDEVEDGFEDAEEDEEDESPPPRQAKRSKLNNAAAATANGTGVKQ